MDFLMNGQGFGSVAATLMQNAFDPRVMRPFLGAGDRGSYIMINTGKRDEKGQPIYQPVPTQNSNATLRVREWIDLDQAILKAARQRLRAVADIRAAGLTYTVGGGMGKTVLQTETSTDPGEAIISMDPTRESRNDRPEYGITNLPLPIIHSDFKINVRQLYESRNGNSPLDTSMGEAAGRRCAEVAEKLLLGTLPTYTYGGGTVYGYTNYPDRITKTLTNPTAGGWTPATLVDELLDMKLQSQLALHYGPWKLYNSPNWDKYLDGDYSAAKGDNTLRQRIAKIDGFQSLSTLDYLTGYQILMIQQTSDVARLVIAMDFTTMQWEEKGGLEQHFKVLGILVPQLRSDVNSKTGIVHGTAP
jgi:hypothetical protein